MVSLRHVECLHRRTRNLVGQKHRRALLLHRRQAGLGHLSASRRFRDDAKDGLHANAGRSSRRGRRALGAAGTARRGQPPAAAIPQRDRLLVVLADHFSPGARAAPGNHSKMPALPPTGFATRRRNLKERLCIKRSPDYWAQWRRSAWPRLPQRRTLTMLSRRLILPTCW